MIKFLKRHWNAKATEAKRNEFCESVARLSEKNDNLVVTIQGLRLKNDALNSQVSDLQKSLETAEQAKAQLLYFKEQLEKERTRLRNENEALCRKIEELLRDHKTISELRRDWEIALEI